MPIGFKKFKGMMALLALSLIGAANGQANVPDTEKTYAEGTRLEQFTEKMKSLFPQATAVKETSVLPAQYGGASLMGLIGRLLGEHVNRDHEGLNVKRYIYRALEGDKPVGVAHGSAFDMDNKSVDVFVYYDPSGAIRELRFENLPRQVFAELEGGGYLKQFVGKTSEDFEVTLGRHGRIKSRAPFLSHSKKPGTALLRAYFDKITRAVRFNAAFMEVAYFISQHPGETESPPEMLSGEQSILKSPFNNSSSSR